jgi:hypothetical protein
VRTGETSFKIRVESIQSQVQMDPSACAAACALASLEASTSDRALLDIVHGLLLHVDTLFCGTSSCSYLCRTTVCVALVQALLRVSARAEEVLTMELAGSCDVSPCATTSSLKAMETAEKIAALHSWTQVWSRKIIIIPYVPGELQMEPKTEGCLYPCGGAI